jgi:alpha-tubulin suppressor-like RCC1 family protein
VRCSSRCAWDEGDVCAPASPTIALTRDGTCAIGSGGVVHCFGNNDGERLGYAATSVFGPKPVRGLPSAQAIVASRVATSSTPHICAIAAGSVYCWGGNQAGKLGLGDVNPRTSATRIDALGTNVLQIALGDDHTCARDASRGILCFGDNSLKQVIGTTQRSLSTPTINPEVGVKNFWLSAGALHTCVVRETNRPMCWGSGQSGEIGDGVRDPSNRPSLVAGATTNVTRMALGFRSSFAVLADGTIASWGLNSSSQLGDGDIENRALPALVTALGSDNVDVVAGNVYACALKRNGSVFCWGTGASGELGQGSLNPVRHPTRIDALGTDVIEIVAGDAHTCVRKRDGSLWCWGRNNFGQSNGADPSASPLHTPTRIPLP